MTAKLRSLSVIVRPTAASAPPNSRCAKAYDTSASGCASRSSSSCFVNVRPAIGVAPSISK
jgi:hypothetical protein